MNKWDERFLILAGHVATWSKDPSTQVGAVIAHDKEIVALGFNGFPRGIGDYGPRLNNRDVKYKFIIHAEENAILFAGHRAKGCTLYTTPFPPCMSCARIIIQSGIARVVAPLHMPERWKDDMFDAKAAFTEAGVKVEYYEWPA